MEFLCITISDVNKSNLLSSTKILEVYLHTNAEISNFKIEKFIFT